MSHLSRRLQVGRRRGRFGALEVAYERAFWLFHGGESRRLERAFRAAAARSATRRLPSDGDPVRVAFLVEGDAARGQSPAARLRVLAHLPYLEAHGIRATVHVSRPAKFFAGFHKHLSRPWLSRSFREIHGLLEQERARYHDLVAAMDADVIYVQRELQEPGWSRLESILPVFHDRVVFDFDDAIFASEDFRQRLDQVVTAASTVVVSTPFLEEYVRGIHGRVHRIPTPIDLEAFTPPPAPPANPKPVIGWIGTGANLRYLRQILPALERLAAREPFVLRVMTSEVPSAERPRLVGAPCELSTWSLERELPFLHSLDVGIMPLEDSTWTRGKAGFKLIQYMACGIATVSSPVGFNLGVVGPEGQCGLYAATESEWVEKLAALLRDPSRRRLLGRAGRERVSDRFDIRKHAATLARTLREVATRPDLGALRPDGCAPRSGRPLLYVADLDTATPEVHQAVARARSLAGAGQQPLIVTHSTADRPAREVEGDALVVRLVPPRFLTRDPARRTFAAFLARHGHEISRVEFAPWHPSLAGLAAEAVAAKLPVGVGAGDPLSAPESPRALVAPSVPSTPVYSSSPQ
jgi:glycosyltransferase involved in cell wall biosynthesis